MIVVLFHRQRDNLTEHLQIKFHHSSLILIGGIECVTIAPGLPYSRKKSGTHSQEHPYGAHIFTPSLFFINPDMCLKNSVRTFLCSFCAYGMFIHEAPGPSLGFVGPRCRLYSGPCLKLFNLYVSSIYLFVLFIQCLSFFRCVEWMNEWMMHLYSALLCIAVHPKRFTIMWGSLFNHHQCAASTTSVQHPLGWCDGSHRAHHTPATGGEEREWWSQSSGWGLLGGYDW